MISKQKVQELVEERMAELANGLFIVDLTISVGNVIHVELDKHEGGVSVNDCVSVSRNVEHNLDREQEDFELHVSSAGLDRPLRVHAQYVKNIGRTVKVVLNTGEKHEGELKSVDQETITIENSRMVKPEGDGLSLSKSKKKMELVVEQHTFPFKQIKETKIVISFK